MPLVYEWKWQPTEVTANTYLILLSSEKNHNKDIQKAENETMFKYDTLKPWFLMSQGHGDKCPQVMSLKSVSLWVWTVQVWEGTQTGRVELEIHELTRPL